MRPVISVRHLRKLYNHHEVFRNFSLDIAMGKITAVIGPNGSGKSTLLNILSGITSADGGQIEFTEKNRFQTSYIFQNYRESLLPWKTNFDNVALPLEVQGNAEQKISHQVRELQAFFEFTFDWNDYPYHLSGGQQQILAFIRALVTYPQVLFIDEPFSALDYENNLRLREHLQKYFLMFRPTILLITHNIEEAVHLAQKIVIFSQKPTRVLKVITNPLPYPRNLQTLKSEEFHQIKDRVLSQFLKTVSL